MNWKLLLVLPLVLGVARIGDVRADDKEEIKIKTKDDDGNKKEFKMKVKKKGDRFVTIHDGREFVIRGDRVSTLSEGDYYFTGRFNDVYFDATAFRPYTIEKRTVIEERPVIRERVIEERSPKVDIEVRD